MTRVFAIIVLTALLPGPFAAAQEAPQCMAQSLGQVACFVNKLCECKYVRGGTVTGVLDGYRWDCGITQPGCGLGADTPADLNAFEGPYPAAVGIDRSRDTTIIKNDNQNSSGAAITD